MAGNRRSGRRPRGLVIDDPRGERPPFELPQIGRHSTYQDVMEYCGRVAEAIALGYLGARNGEALLAAAREARQAHSGKVQAETVDEYMDMLRRAEALDRAAMKRQAETRDHQREDEDAVTELPVEADPN